MHFGSYRIDNPGDYCDVLVAMNPAALKANRKWLKPGATVILDGDTLTEDNIRKAGFATLDPIEELGLSDYNVVAADITTMTREALADMELDNKSVVKCKNMFALGICFWIYNRPEDHAKQYLQSKFAKKNPLVAEANKRAIDAGYNYAANTPVRQHLYGGSGTAGKGNLSFDPAATWLRHGASAPLPKAGLPLFCTVRIPLRRRRSSSKSWPSARIWA